MTRNVQGEVKASAVVRLYTCSLQSGGWVYSGKWGALALAERSNGLEQGRTYYLVLVDIQDNGLTSSRVVWQQELFPGISIYEESTPLFHTLVVSQMSSEEPVTSIYGLSFATSTTTAGHVERFYRTAASVLHHQVSLVLSCKLPLACSSSTLPRGQSSGSFIRGSSSTIPAGSVLSQSSAGTVKKKEPSTTPVNTSSLKKKGWFSKITDSLGISSEDTGTGCNTIHPIMLRVELTAIIYCFIMCAWTPEIELSGPTNFRHESHIGWDSQNGFEIRNIPPEWRQLFQAAGVRKSELRDGIRLHHAPILFQLHIFPLTGGP